jgi:hypothetical protein
VVNEGAYSEGAFGLRSNITFAADRFAAPDTRPRLEGGDAEVVHLWR